MTHIPGLMSSNGMGLSWCCIETPFFTTLSLSLNSESDKMLESFNFHHFHLVEQLLPFSCEMEQKYVVYQDRNYARNKKVEYCLFCPSFLYLFLWEEKEKQRFFKRKWLIYLSLFSLHEGKIMTWPPILQAIFVQSLFKTDLHSEQ